MTDEKDEAAAIDAYADHDNAGITEGEHKTYLRARLEGVKTEYTSLQLQRWEAEGAKNEPLAKQIGEALSRNYRHRKFIVKTLRAMGEAVEDKFIPA